MALKVNNKTDEIEQPSNSSSDVCNCMKIGARTLGVVGGVVAVITGVWISVGLITGDLMGFIIGVWQGLSGLLCTIVEAPYIFPRISDFAGRKPYWMRGLLYVGLALPPIFFKYGTVWVWLGSGAILGTGTLYGFVYLGKRAPLGQTQPSGGDSSGASSRPVGQRATLVDSAAPMGTSRPPEVTQ